MAATRLCIPPLHIARRFRDGTKPLHIVRRFHDGISPLYIARRFCDGAPPLHKVRGLRLVTCIRNILAQAIFVGFASLFVSPALSFGFTLCCFIMDHFLSEPSNFGDDWTGHDAPSSLPSASSSNMPSEPTQPPPTPPWRVDATTLPSASSSNTPSSTEPGAADPYAKWQRTPPTGDDGMDMDGREFKGKGNIGMQQPVRDPVHAADPTSSYFRDQPKAEDLAWLDQLSLDYWRSDEVMRSGKNGGRVRHGRSGGKHQPYYAAFYRAKGKGKAMMKAFVLKHGKPPGKGGESHHSRSYHV